MLQPTLPSGLRQSPRACMAAKPDAIFFANDILALGGMDCLRNAMNLRIPHDVSVVGFDDIPMAGWPSYNLTTVRQPVDHMVERAVSALSGPEDAASDLRLEGELVLRGSVRAVGG